MADWRPRTKRKRWGRRGPTPNELFPALATTPLAGALVGGAVWLPADDRVSKLLNGVCLGTPAGGARAAAEIAAAAAAAGAPPQLAAPPRVAIRLSLEEAFFLAYVLGTLVVVADVRAEGGAKANDATHTQFTVDELWDAATAARPGFMASYVTYHHYRCKGWTVRSGLRYGTDYVLYAGHPAAAHADVAVLAVEEGEAPADGGDSETTVPPTLTHAIVRPARPLAWLDVEIGNRLACQVGKRLLLAHVVVDGGRARGGAPPPRPADLLSRVTVEERLVERWVPDADREAPIV